MKTTFRVSWDRLECDPAAFVHLEVTSGDLHMSLVIDPADVYKLCSELKRNANLAIDDDETRRKERTHITQ
jgi:hypothetical protein